MPSLAIRILLFLSSYFPLALITFVLLLNRTPLVAWVIMVFALLGLAGLVLYLTFLQRRVSPVTLSPSHVRRRDGEVMSYVATYLLPFVALPSADVPQFIGLGIFIFVLCILYINSEMIFINPVLNLAGYHLYSIETNDGVEIFLLARGSVSKMASLKVVLVGNDTAIRIT